MLDPQITQILQILIGLRPEGSLIFELQGRAESFNYRLFSSRNLPNPDLSSDPI